MTTLLLLGAVALLISIVITLRSLSTRIASVAERVDANRDSLLEFLSLRLPEPSEAEIRQRAHRLAMQFGQDQYVLALRAFQTAALSPGQAEKTRDISDENMLTAREWGELSRHLQFKQMRKDLSADDLAKLSPEQKERAHRQAEWYAQQDVKEVEEKLFQELWTKAGLA